MRISTKNTKNKKIKKEEERKEKYSTTMVGKTLCRDKAIYGMRMPALVPSLCKIRRTRLKTDIKTLIIKMPIFEASHDFHVGIVYLKLTEGLK